MITHSINYDYAEREGVLNWLFGYFKRNKITCEICFDSRQIKISFKSAWQMSCFQRRANSIFPYFEFL